MYLKIAKKCYWCHCVGECKNSKLHLSLAEKFTLVPSLTEKAPYNTDNRVYETACVLT